MFTKASSSLKNTFDQGIRWNTLGSIAYESFKVIHQVALLGVMDIALYGHVGVLFSLIFLTVNISNIAADSTIAAFVSTFTSSKSAFIRTFVPYLLFQIPLLMIGGSVALFIYHKNFVTTASLPAYIILLIILFEGLRTVLRVFLHSIFMNKITIFIELFLMLVYMGNIWGAHLILGAPITLSLIFIPYLLTSITAIVFFLALCLWYISNLPSHTFVSPSGFWARVARVRFFNYSTKLSKQLFTGNFLVPLFALRFGLTSAGIFKFASYLADGVRGVINVTIGFSGGALFAKLKFSDLNHKKKAFYVLSEKLNTIMYCILIILSFNYYAFWSKAASSIIILSWLFLLILVLEHFCSVYEQIHIVEEQTPIMFIAKACEVIIGYCTLLLHGSPLPILINLIVARLTGFALLATNAFRTWGIKPYFKVRSGLIATCMLLSLLVLIMQKLHSYGYYYLI